MRDEREQKRDDTESGVQSRRDQQVRETEQPDKTLSREGPGPSRGPRFPGETRGFNAGQKRGTARQYARYDSPWVFSRDSSSRRISYKQKSSLPVQEK